MWNLFIASCSEAGFGPSPGKRGSSHRAITRVGNEMEEKQNKTNKKTLCGVEIGTGVFDTRETDFEIFSSVFPVVCSSVPDFWHF